MHMARPLPIPCAALLAVPAAPALAQPADAALVAAPSASLPAPVRAMIEAAMASGDAQKVAAVVDVARQTNPAALAEIDALDSAHRARIAAREAAQRAEEQERLRHAGLLRNWHGRGEVGAFQSSGNADNTGLSLALDLERKGLAWQHKLSASADYQRSNGITTSEKYRVTYEPRYTISKTLFVFGLAQFEHDRLQGIAERYSVSGGLGYRAIDTARMQLSLKAGPAFRRTVLADGSADDGVGGLAGLDFNWSLNPRLRFTQNSNLVAGTGGGATLVAVAGKTSVNLVSGLEMKVSNRLTTRLSYTYDYNSNPPAGNISTDTLSRFTLIYGF